MEPFIFISGATGGLGSAFALECAGRGYNLCLTDKNENGGEFARSLQEEYNIDCRYFACDMTSSTERQNLYQKLQESGLRFWGLINVAGLDYEGDFLGRSRDEVLKIVQLNVESTLDTTYAILNLRETQKWFRLVNVCSLAAYNPMPYKAVYAASKRFLLDFSAALREEILPFGTVTALCPAGMPTTPENMRAIFAQGFWGKVTTVDQQTVARQTVDAALRGKQLCIPGWINRLIQAGSSLIPASLTVKIIESRWKNSRESNLEIKNGVPIIRRPEPKIRALNIRLV